MWKCNSILRWSRLVSLTGLLTCISATLNTQAQTNTIAPTKYLIVVLKGNVQLARAGSHTFDPARTNQSLFIGDHVRVGPESQLTIRRGDQSVYRFDEKTDFYIQGPRTASSPRASFRLLAGILYFF